MQISDDPRPFHKELLDAIAPLVVSLVVALERLWVGFSNFRWLEIFKYVNISFCIVILVYIYSASLTFLKRAWRIHWACGLVFHYSSSFPVEVDLENPWLVTCWWVVYGEMVIRKWRYFLPPHYGDWQIDILMRAVS